MTNMFAQRELPVEYQRWNRRWGAPSGFRGLPWPLRGTRYDVRKRGPFGFQANNSIREFEYPWAYHEISKLGRGLTIIDVGGSLGGLQFVLAREGHRVLNVDPGMRAGGLGWDVDPSVHRWLTRRLGADVALIPETLAEAGLPPASADVVLCISSLEHFSDDDLSSSAQAIRKILKPSGVAVVTVDCFLDLAPFSNKQSNKWGRNISIHAFLEDAQLHLVGGRKADLLGMPEFNAAETLSRLHELHVGRGYPCLAQCFTARHKSNGDVAARAA